MVAKGNNHRKGKTKLSYAPKPKIPPPPKKYNPAKDMTCHQCGEVGHWRRNFPQYLAELMKNKKLAQGASTSGIFTIKLYSFPSKSWVYDTSCGTHICNTTQGLRGSKKLKPGALNLYMGNGHHVAVEAIGTFHLCLPSGFVVILNNCHYAYSITRGIISVSLLKNNGFVNCFIDNGISISKDGLLYFHAIPRDGIYEIDLHCANSNDSSIYAISNKRAKLNLDSTLLWHCRLRHISKKQIEKLQHDGLLNSTDIESFDKCISCLSSKMTRKPYSHQVERAKDLLGLIHTDEVGNQLKKTIKSLRSDREGEYMSQEFLDHLKEHGIITHRTPAYTPQHNGVSERRNRTLLDMALVKRDTLTKLDKLEPRSIKCIFIGYPKETMGYSFYYPPKNKVLVAQNAEFFKNSLITQEASGILEDIEIIQDEDTYPSENTSLHHDEDDQEIDEPQSDIIPVHKSIKTRHAPNHMCLYVDVEEYELGDLNEPTNYKAALLDPESDKWLAAMNVEMQSMKDNQDWDLVDLPPNGKTVGSKWLFKMKTDMEGNVHTYKAHLVAKGFTQTNRVDYDETLSPVADIRAIKILISIVAFYDYEI
ncbi:retrotransposon protein, putative, ty1-copia subclass [Tanacetum coccineum]